MIRNDRQLSAARRKLQQAREAAEAATDWERDVYERLARTLTDEIGEYVVIRQGGLTRFVLHSFDELDDALAKARVARGLTQRELSERLGVSEQMVQRDEIRGYGHARLSRLAEIADVLEYVLEGELRPREAPSRWIHVGLGGAWSSVEEGPVLAALPTIIAQSSVTVWHQVPTDIEEQPASGRTVLLAARK